MILIGFSGRARSGKDTACAAIIRDCAPGEVLPYSISGEILSFCQEHGAIAKHLTREELGKPELDLIVKFSYDMRNAYGEDFWMRRIEQRMLGDAPLVALIPNLRTVAELPWLKRLGGYHVHVERVNADGSPHISLDRDPNDLLETALLYSPADFYIKAGGGQVPLVRSIAVTIFDFIRSNHVRPAGA